jgi:DNA mismatch repair protein MutL
LNAAVRESLGKFNVVPSLDFDTEMAIPISTPPKNAPIKIPSIRIDPNYNPFAAEQNTDTHHSVNIQSSKNLPYWETLLSGFENERKRQESSQSVLFPSEPNEQSETNRKFVQIKGKYIFIPSKSGFMLVDQRRAHERILYDQFLTLYRGTQQPTQKQLFPQTISLSANDYMLIESYADVIRQAGFEIRCIDNFQIEIYGYPAFLENTDIKRIVEDMISHLHLLQTHTNIEESLARILSKSSAIPYGKTLSDTEMEHLIDRLFACSDHRYTPDGKPIITLFTVEEIDRRMG